MIMDDQDSPQHKREKLLYRYHRALKREDSAAINAVLAQTERDPDLRRMVTEYQAALSLEQKARSARGWSQGRKAARLPSSGGFPARPPFRPPQWWGEMESGVGSTLRHPDQVSWR